MQPPKQHTRNPPLQPTTQPTNSTNQPTTDQHLDQTQKSSKRDPGFRDVPVSFAGVTIKPGDWVYADADGVLVAPDELKL
jgi:hypothetical protein